MFNAKIKKENRKAILSLDKCYLPPKGNTFKRENCPVSSKCNRCIAAHGYGCYLRIQIALHTISNIEETNSSYALAISVSVLEAVNWIGLAVTKIKTESVKKCFAMAGFGESDAADNLEEAS
jgi:hypothetical protein